MRWCPGPRVRTMHVLEMTAWNDAPERRQADVQDLLQSARTLAEVQLRRCREERLVLTTA